VPELHAAAASPTIALKYHCRASSSYLYGCNIVAICRSVTTVISSIVEHAVQDLTRVIRIAFSSFLAWAIGATAATTEA